MKYIMTILLTSFLATHSNAQLWKEILRDTKNDVKWKIRSKANQKIDQGLDSLLAPPNKQSEKKKSKSKAAEKSANTNSNNGSKTAESDGMNYGEGFIKLSLSATEVFRGGTVIVTGSSVNYGNLRQVKMIIDGPGADDEETLQLYENGTFAAGWEAEQSGEFTITVASSDGKDRQSAKVKVYDIEVMDDLWVKDNIELVHKTYDKLKKEAERVEALLAERDKADLEKRMKAVGDNVESVLQLFNELSTAVAGLSNIIKSGPLPPYIADNLSQLNDKLEEQETQMQQVAAAADHEPADNTICEYLVMLNEACAAFSTLTSVWSKSIVLILKNTVLERPAPKGVEGVNPKNEPLSSGSVATGKQAAKLFVTSQLYAEKLVTKLSAASFTVDLTQFASEMLMKKYCGVFTGELKHDYKITYRNNAGVTWWSYSYETAAAITFRYPKTSSGKIIKMKGNIEGNATKFSFFQDIEQMDDFREQMKGRAKLTPIALWKPVAVPFATSQKDEVGFGAIARGVATPSYFNIPVDAEYDTETETIKVFLNEALIDFTPMVKYTYGYVAVAAGIPLVTRVDYPINKAKLTLNAVLSRNNEITVTRDAGNNLVIKSNGNRHIGSSGDPIEHDINFSLSAKNK